MSGGLWSIFGGMGAGSAPAPQPSPVAPQPSPVVVQEERKSDERQLEDALKRDARRKCSGMGMGNHITAFNALRKLTGVHKAWMLANGYSAVSDSVR